MRKFFTLIELLVVIAIISILAAMILPALNSAREKVRSTQCMSNIKNCGVALFSYALDHEELIPSNVPDCPDWYRCLYTVKYLQEYKVNSPSTVVTCPTEPYYRGSWNTYGLLSPRWSNGSPENNALAGFHEGNDVQKAYFLSMKRFPAYSKGKDSIKVSQFIIMADSRYRRDLPFSWCKIEPDRITVTSGGLSMRHNRETSANVLMLDGHVEGKFKDNIRYKNKDNPDWAYNGSICYYLNSIGIQLSTK